MIYTIIKDNDAIIKNIQLCDSLLVNSSESTKEKLTTPFIPLLIKRKESAESFPLLTCQYKYTIQREL